jgi:restriction endonuclease
VITSPSELADRLVAGFDRQAEVRLDHALIKLLRDLGFERFRSEEIAWKVEDVVARLLQERQPEDLPFRLCDGGKRLVGKARIGVRDNPETAFARNAEALSIQLLNTLVALTADDFEVLSAASMVLSGAQEMKALCTGDEGGIDFYGRLPIRQPSALIPKGLIHTTLLPKELLVLGQAKRYQRNARVGRPDIQQFKGQLQDCMKQYEGNERPPTHRVPESYYKRDEPFLGVFVTTASFAETATTCVEASGIVLIPGVPLSQFLAFHHVGIVQDEKGFRFDQNEFDRWLATQRRNLTQTGSSFQ